MADAPGLKAADTMVACVTEAALSLGCKRIEFRMAPKIQCREPCDELDFAWLARGARIRDWELSTCYPLSRIEAAGASDAFLLSTFEDACRRSTRKALRSGLEARLCASEEDFSTYWRMLELNLVKHGAKPTHSCEELIDLKHRFPDHVHLLGVFMGERMAGGIVAFVCNAVCAHVFYFASDPAMQNHRPLNLGVLRLIQMAAERGLRYVNFGISTEDRGRRINAGLFRFKESFGGAGILRTYWVWESDGDG